MFKANAKAQCVHFISSQNKEMVPTLMKVTNKMQLYRLIYYS